MSARSLAWRRGSSALRRSCARAPRTPPGRLRPTRRASLLGRGVERAPASRVPSPVTKERLASSWPNRSWMRSSITGPSVARAAGGDLDRSDHAAPPHRHQVTELPPIAVRVTEHRAHSLRCPGCGTSTRAHRCPRRSAKAPSDPGCRRRSHCFLCATGSLAAMPPSSAASCLAAKSRPARSMRSASALPAPWPSHTPGCARRSRTHPSSASMRPAGAAPGKSEPCGAQSPTALPPSISPPIAMSVSCRG